MTARTAHVIPGGAYLPMTAAGRTRRVPTTHLGVWCELCEWAVLVPKRHGHNFAEGLRRQHLMTIHGDAMTAGACVVNPELRHLATGGNQR